ncbi:hypothetical protein [Aureimonas sp. AU12]|uniref:hypothetical protein n=1 Tax=Aureimonas sp. AU12 TaxID=1638161 RepID=UPI000784DBEA|nr:hypothetical protein [Aureimonas sp. AU12]
MSDTIEGPTMQEFLAALVSFFLIQPLQAEMAERLGPVSGASVAAVTSCLREATPVLVDRASTDPWGLATDAFGIWTGMTAPETILAATTPGCAAAIAGLRASGAEPQS